MRMYLSITDERPPDIGKRRFSEFSRAGMAAVGNLWDREFKMRHFQPDAASRYGYALRAKKYQEGKERRAGRSRSISPDAATALVYTGALRRAARLNQIARAFPTRVTINIPTPHYVAMRPRRAGIPNLGEEMTRATADERRAMEAEYQITVEGELNEFREARTTTIGN